METGGKIDVYERGGGGAFSEDYFNFTKGCGEGYAIGNMIKLGKLKLHLEEIVEETWRNCKAPNKNF